MTGFATYIDYWKRYFDFEGKSTRTQFWMVVLFDLLIGLVVGLFALIPGAKKIFDVIDYIWSIVNLIPGLAISVRRLRDAGKSWTNLFWMLLPLVGWIILIVLFCQPSIEEPSAPATTTEA